jgi:hypothetical protein
VKVLAFILSVVVATALVLGGTLIIVFQLPNHSIGLLLLATFSLIVLIYGPLALGSLTAYWNVRRTEASRSYYKRWLWVVIGLEVLGAIAIVLFTVVAGAPPWLPVMFIGGGAALTAIAPLVGRLLLRHEESQPRVDSWAPITRNEIRRKLAVVTITFVAVFAAALIVLAVLSSERSVLQASAQMLYALAFAFLGAGFACIIVSVPLNRRLRDAVGRELGTVRKVSKVVLGRKHLDLNQDEQVAAAKFAAIIPTTLGFMLSYLTLLYLGIGTQQVERFMVGGADAFTIGFSILLVVVLVVFIPIYAVRINRARKYARAHSDLLPAGGGENPPSTGTNAPRSLA